MQDFIKFLPLSIAIVLAGCSAGTSSSSSTSGWVWINGGNQSNGYGVYGIQGVAALSNIPGSRDLAISWIDNNNNLWLFGGSGNVASGASGNLNDLWKYNISTNQWTWVGGSNTVNAFGVYGTKGVASLSNIPGARFGGVSWQDAKGNLWQFGGVGYAVSGDAGSLNDLWEYNISNNEWAWISGSSTVGASGVYGAKGVVATGNIPGARLGSVAWTDNNGNLWLFGGEGKDVAGRSGLLNDLWKYNPATNEWTWVRGQQVVNVQGTYGVQGVQFITNEPGARLDSVGWVDSNNNLWMFGGSGLDAAGVNGELNDLWVYNQSQNQWTWMSGGNMTGMPGIYDSLGIFSPNSIPGARKHRIPLARFNNTGNSWMFGGDGSGATTNGYLNDLWTFNSTNNQWAWVNGSTESNAFGSYGSQGVLAAANVPGARRDGVGWVDRNGNVWLFGGDGNGMSSSGTLNDLWKYSN